MNRFDFYLQSLVGFLKVTNGRLGACDLRVAFKHLSVQIAYLEKQPNSISHQQNCIERLANTFQKQRKTKKNSVSVSLLVWLLQLNSLIFDTLYNNNEKRMLMWFTCCITKGKLEDRLNPLPKFTNSADMIGKFLFINTLFTIVENKL